MAGSLAASVFPPAAPRTQLQFQDQHSRLKDLALLQLLLCSSKLCFGSHPWPRSSEMLHRCPSSPLRGSRCVRWPFCLLSLHKQRWGEPSSAAIIEGSVSWAAGFQEPPYSADGSGPDFDSLFSHHHAGPRTHPSIDADSPSVCTRGV